MIFLYGPPGAGKSTIGRALAAALDIPFWDADDEIEREAGQAIPAIFAQEGEAGFRQRETAVVTHLLTQKEGVVALGGGALLDEALRARVEAAGPVLCLHAPLELLLARLDAAEAERPLLASNLQERLPHLLAQRAAHYASFAHQLDAAGEASAIAWAAQVALGRFHVRGMDAGYDVLVQPGGLLHLGELLRARGLAGPIALVSDEHVFGFWGETAVASLQAAGYAVHPVVMPPGEAHKTMETVGGFWDAFLAAGLERSSTVVALGGGVVGDLAGFAAATFLRGVPWVGVPTSLLAMVDASVGGKTGVDLPQGKNLVGAFYAPRLVLADPDVLATLPPAELRSGLGEVVKHGVIGDPALFELCARGETAVASLQAAGYAVHPVVMPPGEAHKTMETVGGFWDAFLAAGLERSSTVVALGGGVVGDLAGFAAATFLRGVPWVGVPTSLLAMVDASVGGKTGVDLPQGKNLVGAFYAPRLVLADPDVLATLPPAELRSGLGEVVKHGVIGDPALFELCARGETAVGEDWAQLVRRAMAVKIAIIQQDPYEGGRRAALNLGHTIGHAVELVSGFRLRHGEAVAIGMVAEAGLAERMGLAQAGLADAIAGVLAGLGLPTEIPRGLDGTAVVQAVGVDKKRKGGRVKFALPVRVGEVVTGVDVPNWYTA